MQLHPDIAAVLSGERRWAVIMADCLDVLPTLPSASVGAVVTDPPYGIGEAYNSVDDTRENLRALVTAMVPEMRRVAPVVLITPGNGNQWVYPEADWTLAWVERAGVGINRWGFTCWQPVLCYGPNPHLANSLGARPDVYLGWGESASSKLHPCAKPVGIMNWLIERAAVKPDTVILDPCAGVGTTGVACMMNGHRFIGIEIDAKYADIARRRIAEASTHLFNGSAA